MRRAHSAPAPRSLSRRSSREKGGSGSAGSIVAAADHLAPRARDQLRQGAERDAGVEEMHRTVREDHVGAVAVKAVDFTVVTAIERARTRDGPVRVGAV